MNKIILIVLMTGIGVLVGSLFVKVLGNEEQAPVVQVQQSQHEEPASPRKEPHKIANAQREFVPRKQGDPQLLHREDKVPFSQKKEVFDPSPDQLSYVPDRDSLDRAAFVFSDTVKAGPSLSSEEVVDIMKQYEQVISSF